MPRLHWNCVVQFQKVRDKVTGLVIAPASICAMKTKWPGWLYDTVTLEHVGPLCHLSTETPTTVVCCCTISQLLLPPSSCLRPKVAADRCRRHALAVTLFWLELDQRTLSHCRHSMVAGNYWLCAKLPNHRSRGWEPVITPSFSTPLVSSLPRACSITICNYASLSVLARDYQLHCFK